MASVCQSSLLPCTSLESMSVTLMMVFVTEASCRAQSASLQLCSHSCRVLSYRVTCLWFPALAGGLYVYPVISKAPVQARGRPRLLLGARAGRAGHCACSGSIHG